MTITKSIIWMLVMVVGFATSEAWAQHSEHGTLRGAPPEQLGDEDEVAARRDRKELRQSLDDPEDDRVQHRQGR